MTNRALEMGRGKRLLWTAFAVGVLSGVVACGVATQSDPAIPDPGAPSAEPLKAPHDPAPGPSAVPEPSGPAPSVTVREPEPAGAPTAPSRKLPAGKRCEDFRFGSCPEGCVEQCVGSCPTCDDCGGKGSCHTL